MHDARHGTTLRMTNPLRHTQEANPFHPYHVEDQMEADSTKKDPEELDHEDRHMTASHLHPYAACRHLLSLHQPRDGSMSPEAMIPCDIRTPT